MITHKKESRKSLEGSSLELGFEDGTIERIKKVERDYRADLESGEGL